MSNNKYKILVVEDDHNIASFIHTVLETNGYQVLLAERCRQGILMVSSHMPDLVVLDLGLPDADGEEFIRVVRVENTVPIIVLSARTQEQDKVYTLDLGANDYITKPFGTAELLARVRAALRISRHSIQASAPGSTFQLDDLVIDYDRRQVSVSGEVIHMTQTEYNILAFLSQHVGKVMTYSAIIRSIWGAMDTGSTKKLQVNMANIRKKLGCAPGDNRYVVNELGVGYRMLDTAD
ncbi:MAG: response regulator transcription factor [Oscillospiraceae bacterium]|nr:response regulator transcription factor [Oscillospiraceae bacterium]